MDFFCQSAEARIAFRVALNALIDAKHQKEIPLKIIFRFGQLFVREMGIQVADGWGGFRFHCALTYRLTSFTHRRQNVSKAASHKKCSPANGRTAFQIRTKMDYSDFLPAALILAQRAFAAAEILALAAALIVRFLAGALAAGFADLIFAQRAF